MMQAILCMHPGERRPLKVFQVANGTQPLDCDGLARLGFTVELDFELPGAFTVTREDFGWLIECTAVLVVTPEPCFLRAYLHNTAGEAVAIGGIICMAVPVGWLPVPDLAVAPGPLLAEGADAPPEASRIVLANG